MIFGRRKNNLNDIFREFDEMYSQFDSIFGGLSNKSEIEKGSDEFGNWSKETFMSDDGAIQVTSFIRTGNSPSYSRGSTLSKLKQELKTAVENENFEDAVKIRDQIKKHESNQEAISKLENELKQVIKDHNFERAIEIRDELKKLK